MLKLLSALSSVLLAGTAAASVNHIQSMKKETTNYRIFCTDGSEEMKTSDQIRRDDVCGGPAVSAVKEKEHYRRFDFGGDCSRSDQQWAVDKVKFELTEKIATECYRGGWSKYTVVDAFYAPGCEPLWGPTANGKVFFRCSN